MTITGTLSGSHNSAQLAKNIYLEDHPDTQIHVIDSLSAGGEVDLIVEKINDLIDQGLSFEEVVEVITTYQEKRSCCSFLLKWITWLKTSFKQAYWCGCRTPKYSNGWGSK